MLRVLQSVENKNSDASKKAAVKMNRGALVSVSEKSGTVGLAATLDAVVGIATRDFIVTNESAMGFAVSEYDATQDEVKVDEFVGVMTLLPNERYATSEYDAALVNADVEADKYLTVVNGKLTKIATATKLVSLGWIMDAGTHKLLGFKIKG